jgi:hypothetical protein
MGGIFTWCNSLARQDFNAKPSLIQMLNIDGTSSQSSNQFDFTSVEKVVILSGEAWVGLLLNLENDITSLNARSLVTFASELDLGAALNAPVDVDVENLSVNSGLLAVALLAAVLILDNFAFTIAVGADSLEALNHRAHLAHHSLHASTIAAGTLADGTVLTSKAVALGADDGSLQRKLGDLATVDILERNLVGVVDGASLGRPAVLHASKHATHSAKATTAEELSKQIFSGHAASATSATLEASFTILIVDLALLGVGQDLVGAGDLLELLFGSGVVGVLVYNVMLE